LQDWFLIPASSFSLPRIIQEEKLKTLGLLSREELVSAIKPIVSRGGIRAKIYLNDFSALLGETPDVVLMALKDHGLFASDGSDMSGKFIRVDPQRFTKLST
jgi:hypothetical protein